MTNADLFQSRNRRFRSFPKTVGSMAVFALTLATTSHAADDFLEPVEARQAPPSPTEIATEIITRFDQDGNAKLNQSELVTAIVEREAEVKNRGSSDRRPRAQGGLQNRPEPETIATSLIANNDTDEDGELSADELAASQFVTGAQQLAERTRRGGNRSNVDPSTMAQRLFERADSDGDNSLTEEELVAAMKDVPNRRGGAGGRDPEERAKAIFLAADSDQDETLTLEELSQGMAELMDRRRDRR